MNTIQYSIPPRWINDVGALRGFYKLTAFVLSILYGSVLSSLPMDGLIDRANYLNYADYSTERLLLSISQGFFLFLSNEPLWLLLNALLATVLPSAEDVVRLYIFMSATLFSYFFIRANPRYTLLLIVFLFAPQLVKNYIVHLRQGVAIAVFFCGWCLISKKSGWMLMLLSPFIHSSFFFVLALISFAGILARLRLSASLLISVFVLLGSLLVVLAPWVAQVVGARQVGDNGLADIDVSGIGFLFWFAVLMLFVVQGPSFIKQNLFQIFSLQFYLLSYFLLPWSARIFESTLCLLLLSGLSLRAWRKTVFILLFIVYVLLGYIVRLDKQFLGFGY